MQWSPGGDRTVLRQYKELYELVNSNLPCEERSENEGNEDLESRKLPEGALATYMTESRLAPELRLRLKTRALLYREKLDENKAARLPAE
jgi:hypothetical protein